METDRNNGSAPHLLSLAASPVGGRELTRSREIAVCRRPFWLPMKIHRRGITFEFSGIGNEPKISSNFPSVKIVHRSSIQIHDI